MVFVAVIGVVAVVIGVVVGVVIKKRKKQPGPGGAAATVPVPAPTTVAPTVSKASSATAQQASGIEVKSVPSKKDNVSLSSQSKTSNLPPTPSRTSNLPQTHGRRQGGAGGGSCPPLDFWLRCISDGVLSCS